MVTVSLTGSYASGKSYVLKQLRDLGFLTFSCDDFIKILYQDENIQTKIIQMLNLKTFDKAKISDMVYFEDLPRQKVEELMHPEILSAIQSFKREFKHDKALFFEVPLLFELSWESLFDHTICVFCSEKTRVKRAEKIKGYTPEKYQQISALQMAQTIKLKKADFYLNTDLLSSDLESNLKNILNKLGI